MLFALSLAAAIVGGTPDASDVAVVDIELAGGQCSGIVVGNRVVVTAAHCISQGSGTAGGANIIATWTDRYYSGDTEHDLAAILVDADLPAVIPIGSPTEGPVTLVGWGATMAGGARGQQRNAVAAMLTDITRFTARAGTAGATTCTGDSGGAALQNGQLVGVITAGDDTCTAASYLVRPDSEPQLAEVIADWTTPSSDPCSFDGTCAMSCPAVDLDCPVTGLAGATCATIYDCESRICDGDDRGHFCSAACETAADCDQPLDACIANHCAYANGTPGIAGDSCHADGDCRSMLCDRDAAVCTVPCGANDACPDHLTCQPVRETRACTTNDGCSTTRGSGSLTLIFVLLAIGRRRRHARAAWQRSTASKYSDPASTATAVAPSARS